MQLLRNAEEEEYQAIRATAVKVLQEFNGLSPAAFWAEVEWRMWPRPNEVDVKAAVMRMICDGWDGMEFSTDRKIVRRLES